jgi:acetyl-CoA decarbonylase/synthase complex subunit gamma
MHDHLGTAKVRLDVFRMQYSIAPGLYAVGSPDAESHVFVTANYKLSLDKLRVALDGMNAWILVLGTRGINVWCAAGKGTFGTDELVNRLAAVHLDKIVTHRKLIVPQLGATGVSAHEVKDKSGFRVTFGPVRAKDIPAFLEARMKATPEMRKVKFPLWDRVVLIPVEIMQTAKYGLLVAAAMIILAGLGTDGYSFERVKSFGLWSAAIWGAGWILGAILPPLLLPLLPGRSFSTKGAIAGYLIVLAIGWYTWNDPDIFAGWVTAGAWLFIIPAITSFMSMNFTGSSTYTSLSGVKKEMLIAVPMQITFASIGVAAWIAGLFVGTY